MKIYSLMWHVDYEGSGLVGVFSTLPNAKRFMKKYEELIKTSSAAGEWVEIYESELDMPILLPSKSGWYQPKIESVA